MHFLQRENRRNLEIKFGEICFFILIIFYFSLASVSAIVLNEILPNAATEYQGEWIEIYNNDSENVNLTGWNITDGEATFTFNGTIINASDFLVLAYNKTNFNQTWINVNATIIEYGIVASNLKLANSGDDIEIRNSSGILIDNITWTSDPGENISIGRYPDASEWNEYMKPTPGSPNSLFSTSPNLQLQVYLSEAIKDISYDQLFKIVIQNKANCSQNKDNVSVVYNVTNGTQLFLSNNFTREIGCSGYADTGYWKPNSTGTFTICGTANSTVNETDFSDNTACANITVAENPLTILSLQNSTTFGSVNLALFKFNTTSYNYNKTRFLFYGTNSRVVADSDWNKITSYATCQGNMAVEFNNSANESYFLLIPFFIYPNCDNDYSNGNYFISLRLCRPSGSSWTKWQDYEFNISINGKNSALCPSCQNSGGGGSTCSNENISKSAEIKYSVLEVPSEINKNFSIKVLLTNEKQSQQEFELWSYVYFGNKCYTAGCREGNKQQISLAPQSSAVVELKNEFNLTEIEKKFQKINETENETFKLKIKILKKGLKTPKEFTFDVVLNLPEKITPQKIEKNITIKSVGNETKLKKENGETIYLSKSQKIKENVVYWFGGLIFTFSIYLIFKKDI